MEILEQLDEQEKNKDRGWAEEELRAAVIAYFEMQKKSRDGVVFKKSKYYADLAEKFDRTEKAFSYRMQNISYVLSLLGRDWLKGLRPAVNVGANIAAEIEKIIGDIEGKKFTPIAAFEVQVKNELKAKFIAVPDGATKPEKKTSLVTQNLRDPKVKAWILWNAGTKCECCENEAPFFSSDDIPYLEVHHLKRMADEGSDRISNAIAVCPNCHRELHYGANSHALVNSLYGRIGRLVRE